MKIIGFGQQMRLDGEMRVQHEITVETDDGEHHVIPTDEATVQKLIQMHASGVVTPSQPARRYVHIEKPVEAHQPGHEDLEDAEEDFDVDPGEVLASIGSTPAPWAGDAPVRAPAGMPRPRYLEDEDGEQV